mgnify:CR=1 FL=1
MRLHPRTHTHLFYFILSKSWDTQQNNVPGPNTSSVVEVLDGHRRVVAEHFESQFNVVQPSLKNEAQEGQSRFFNTKNK